jgi:hypothetical protein
MNIINDNRIYKKYIKDQEIENVLTRSVEDIKEIVIHGAGIASSATGVLNWMARGGIMPDGTTREEQYKKGISLFHSEIDRNGNVYNILSPLFFCYHSSSGHHDRFTLGIELINGEVDNKFEYTNEQYQSLFNMIDAYSGLFPVGTICGHGYNGQKYSGKYKNCPGNFNWDKLQEYFSKEFNIIKIDKECYGITRI